MENKVSDPFLDQIAIKEFADVINDEDLFNNHFPATNPQMQRIQTFEKYRITDSTDIPPPIPVITIAGEIISTEGNITTISGASKSGKSALTSIFIAGAISESGIVDGINGIAVEPNQDRKAVIHIDTEQARHRQQSNVKSILRRAKLDSCPDYYLSYNIRELDLMEYSKLTEDIFAAASNDFNGIHLVVIDGIADYIKDVNDGETSNAIIRLFEGLAVKYHVPVITIVHTNPGSDKERGHLGSQLQRKSESVITVKIDGDISYIEPKFLRMAGKGVIPLLSFKYDKEKGYHVDNGFMQDSLEKKDNARMSVINEICQTAFLPQSSLSYKDAIEAIMKKSGKGETTAKGYFKEMKAHGMITQGPDNNWRSGIIPV